MIWVLGLFFLSGVLLVGLNSHYFPWLNLLGVIIVGIVGLIARKDVS